MENICPVAGAVHQTVVNFDSIKLTAGDILRRQPEAYPLVSKALLKGFTCYR